MTLVTNGRLITRDPEGQGYYEHGAVAYEGTKIVEIGEKYFPDTLGVLKAGAAADIIVMDYKPYTPFSDENIDGHMIFGMTGRHHRRRSHRHRRGLLPGPGRYPRHHF